MTGACHPASIVFDRSAKARTGLHRPRAKAERFSGVCEPSLQELMDDPILSRLMASDGVARDELDDLIATVRNRLLEA